MSIISISTEHRMEAREAAKLAQPLFLIHDVMLMHHLMTTFNMMTITVEAFSETDKDDSVYIHTRPTMATYDDEVIKSAGGADFVAMAILKFFGFGVDDLDDDNEQLIHWLEGDFVTYFLDDKCPIDYGKVLDALRGLIDSDLSKYVFHSPNEVTVTIELLEAYLKNFANSDHHALINTVNSLCKSVLEIAGNDTN